MKKSVNAFFLACIAIACNAALAANEVPLAKSKGPSTVASSTFANTQQMPDRYKTGLIRSSNSRMGIRMFYEFGSNGVDSNGMLTLKIVRLGGGPVATIELQADPAVTMASGLPSRQAVFNAGDEYTVTIKPPATGLHYINVFLQSGNSTEAHAIPVQMGKSTNILKAGETKTTSRGQRVISMPAQ